MLAKISVEVEEEESRDDDADDFPKLTEDELVENGTTTIIIMPKKEATTGAATTKNSMTAQMAAKRQVLRRASVHRSFNDATRGTSRQSCSSGTSASLESGRITTPGSDLTGSGGS